MPGQWTSIETNFPTFTGQEPVEEKINQLHNYMFILTEQLKYNLSNLDKSNWNANALKQLTSDTSSEAAAAIAAQLEQIVSQYAQLNASVANLKTSVDALAGSTAKVDSLEERVDLMEGALGEEGEIPKRLRKLEEDLPALEQQVAGEGGLEERMEDTEGAITNLQAGQDEQAQQQTETAQKVEKLESAVAVEEEAVTVGQQGKILQLVGTVYINGVLYAPAQDEETTEEEGAE